ACGSRQTCGKRQERVSHKVFGRAQNARPHAPQAVHFSLTKDQTKTPEGSTCVRGDVARYCQPSPEWPVFKRSSVAAFQRSVTLSRFSSGWSTISGRLSKRSTAR